MFLKTFSSGYKTYSQSNTLADIAVRVKALGKRPDYDLFGHFTLGGRSPGNAGESFWKGTMRSLLEHR